MYAHAPNSKVKVSFPITAGNIYGEFNLYDQEDTLLHTYILQNSELGALNFNYIVNEIYNDIYAETKGIRTAELSLTDADAIITQQVFRYYLLSPVRLVKGVNSLVTFSEALLEVPDIAKLDGWLVADDSTRIAALIEAYGSFKQFPLRITDPLGLIDYQKMDITELDATGLLALDSRMLKDFQKAQLIQADFLLGGEPAKSLRDTGIISKSVGESTSFFRTTKALNYGITDRAYMLISKYINRSIRLVNA